MPKVERRSERNKISVLVPVRLNSKFLAHFLFGFFAKTENHEDTELLLLLHPKDKWNLDLVYAIENCNLMVQHERGNGLPTRDAAKPNIKIFYEADSEESTMKQRGHHLYLDALAGQADGDWMVCLCDDCDFLLDGWDNYLRYFINELSYFGKTKGLNPDMIHLLIPSFVNENEDEAGWVEFIFSKGYYEVTGRVAGYPNTDSWISSVFQKVSHNHGRVSEMPVRPNMFRTYNSTEELDFIKGSEFPQKETLKYISESLTMPYGPWGSEGLEAEMEREADKLRDAMQKGER